MHLKSLTLKGFKSFASATTLRLEPGITCVVGPNGSGKSNVVDALAWVMGEQGAKSLRGGTMSDVIFAGTSGRPALGRAEVSLTIDNTDGALPIDYSEVTITRTLFRNGGSEYAINGSSCRLLDVQELLSDSGIGREMHVVVGQGQLDAVLQATPEERRGFIEEAAGVLKHRKRKERALRKLESMQLNLTRVQDLSTELRRQLAPLGRQAEVARRAAVVQADQRDSRLRLLADDLVQLSSRLQAEVADDTALRERRGAVEVDLAVVHEQQAALEAVAADQAPRLARAQESYYRLSSLRERFRGTAGLASERLRHLADEAGSNATPGQDPDELEAQARRVREEEATLLQAVASDGARLTDSVAAVKAAEAALATAERELSQAVRARADRREGLARLAGTVAAARSRLEAGQAEMTRLTASRDEAADRAAAARTQFDALESRVAGLDAGEEDLDAEHEQAAAALAQADEATSSLEVEEREAERERSALTARVEALSLGLAHKDGAGSLLGDAATPRLDGVIGTAAGLLTVQPGAEAAISGALGAAADAVAVETLDVALAAIEALRERSAGRAGLLVAAAPSGKAHQSVLPAGAVRATDLVSVPDALRGAVVMLLSSTVVVDNLATAGEVVRSAPGLTAVTREGDVVGAGFVRGGSAGAPSLLEVQAAVDDASARLVAAEHRSERARFALVAAREERRSCDERVEAALARLHESDARMAAVAEELGQFGAQARAATAEADRLATTLAGATDRLDTLRRDLVELEQRLEAAQQLADSPDEAEPSTDGRDEARDALTSARRAEMDARLALRTGEERARALAGRAESLERAARRERETRARAAALRERRAREAEVATDVLAATQLVLTRLDGSLEAAAAERTQAEHDRAQRDEELALVRTRLRALSTEHERLVDSVHRDEVARAEQRLRVEQLRQRALDELGVDPDVLVEDYGPHQPVPPSLEPAGAPGEQREVEPTAYVRAEQEKRLKAADRALALLGKINPLALEEYASLEERHRFLVEQLEDLKSSRRDLLEIVKEVDERVQSVFADAYADTAKEFEGVFSRLFPGGEGRLVLTDPDDMLTTGIEVEARPPGKKVKRLSLLSGGERSLTAVAFLVSIFKARPSPFYVMDEVEAALDDTNLSRLLSILEELRGTSQLIVITHQKRTMEIADALYGVAMRGDGVTTVISQRLRHEEPAPA